MILPVAWAGDHDEAAPPVPVIAASIPDGPPVVLDVRPGDDLQARIRASTAGSTLRLSPGTYAGPVLVDRPMTLVGSPGTVIDGGGRGTVLTLAAPDVHVSDLRVTGGGHEPQANDAGIVAAKDRFRIERVTVDDVYLGIDVRMASDGLVRGCAVTGPGEGSFVLRGDGIRLWEVKRTRVEDNDLVGVRDLVVWYSDENEIVGNRVSKSRYGTHFMHTANNVVEGNTYLDDVVGVFSMYTNGVTIRDNVVLGAHGSAGIGLGFKESEGVVATGNHLADDTTGLYLDNTPQKAGGTAVFTGNVIAGNDVGIRFHGPQRGARFSGNTLDANGLSVTVDGNSDALGSAWDGNTWSDYAGYDLDGDGYGDLPFELTSLTGALRQRRPELAFFQGTPAASLLDLFAAAFPMFAPRPILKDARPVLESR